MEVQAHARCKPCHTSDLSSFLSCWTMPGLERNAREGGGQWAEEEVAAGHPWWRPAVTAPGWVLRVLVSPWGCAGGGSSVPTPGTPCWVGLVTLSCPQSSGGAWADPALPRSLLPSPPWSLLPQLRPQHFRTVHSLQSCPSRNWRCHLPPAPSAASAPWSQLPASPRTHVGGCS